MKRTKPWTDQEIELAKKLFENAKASNRLKQRRVLAVSAGLSGGPTRTAWSEVTWRDYLPDARKSIEDRNGSPMTE